MTRYDEIMKFNVDDLAWFILTLLEETEQNMLGKLAEYGVEVNLVTLDPNIRHCKIIDDLLKEVENDT